MLSIFRVLIRRQTIKTQARRITTKEVMDREAKYSAHNYSPLPVALARGEGKHKIIVKIQHNYYTLNYGIYEFDKLVSVDIFRSVSKFKKIF